MTQQSKFTSGPWKVEAYQYSKRGKSFTRPAAVISGDGKHWISNCIMGHDLAASSGANARLIAASPEMYELLSGLLKTIDKEDEIGSTPLCYNCEQALKRSISKARRIKAAIDGE